MFEKHGFGGRLRKERLNHGYSLRKFAELLGVSSTYLSQVEQQRYAPVTASRAARIAEILGDDPDYWIGLADRIPEDLEPIIRRHPTTMPALIRIAGQLSDDELMDAISEVQVRCNESRTLVGSQSR